ncbi:MAG TPA: carbohydrate kinase family protein [Gemmatimonadales bacterium]|nr:carbohydrate kinase family protein [Gemmatimonadales bacterium]
MKKLGVIGSMVWDEIHGRDPAAPPVEEWGGIAYALGGIDASLPDDWELVPLIKVGRDLAPEAAELLRSLHRAAPGARFIEVPVPNNRVVLHYEAADRRCERMSGGVPAWTWPELGPMVQDLDALYVNFISGFEMCLGTAQALRQGFRGPIYADVHSLFLGMQQDGIRVLRPLPDAADWFACFDAVQVNEDEMRQLSPDPLGMAAHVLGAGVSLLVVTLGPRGAAYVAASGFDGWVGDWSGREQAGADGSRREQAGAGGSGSAPALPRTALVPAPRTDALDPTGCGDVFGAVLCSRLLSGDGVEPALREANRLAARNAAFRGAGGLSRFLRGELVTA